MAENRGKQFEQVIRDAFSCVDSTSVVRLPDPPKGYSGYRNICDFIIYHYPFQYFIECKSVHGNRFPLSNLTDNQYSGLLKMSKIRGVIAGVICWWVDKDITRFIPIHLIEKMKKDGVKSIASTYDSYFWGEYHVNYKLLKIPGKKKRVFFDYNMAEFFKFFE